MRPARKYISTTSSVGLSRRLLDDIKKLGLSSIISISEPPQPIIQRAGYFPYLMIFPLLLLPPRLGGRSFGRSVVRSFGRSVVRSLSCSVAQSFGRSVAQSLGRFIPRSVHSSVAQSLGPFIPRSFGRSVAHFVGSSTIHDIQGDNLTRDTGQSENWLGAQW